MTNNPNFQFADFIKPAFADKSKYTLIRAWRQSWKTFWAAQWIIYQMMKNRQVKWLWVDTVQANIAKYVDRYFKPIMGDFWETIDMDNQKNIMKFMNGSLIDFWSAERPENLEGFWYDFVVLNEAWIILKKEWLWERTLQPMTKNAQVKFVWTPKGKTDHKYFELSKLSKTDPEWADYVFSCYDSPYWQKEQLDNIQATIAAYLWLQEYMAQFVDVYENSILNQDHVRYYNDIDINDFDNLYMHCDTTHTWKETSDYFCSVVLWESKKDKNFYVVDFILEKLDVEAQARWTIVLYEKHSQRIKKLTYDEKANQWFGFWIKKLAKEEYKISLPIEELWYPNDKIAHFTPHVPHFKSNRVFLPKNHAKITIATNQLLAFPTKWINDDFVDGVSWVLDNFKIETMDDLDFSIW